MVWVVWGVTSGIALLQACTLLIRIIEEWATHEGLGEEDCNPNPDWLHDNEPNPPSLIHIHTIPNA